ncbi:MAG: hypothetical protein M1524_02915 [Patescibacteria group bacterium]|nr:hypothetical protein [Patescibacteria group bacterium]
MNSQLKNKKLISCLIGLLVVFVFIGSIGLFSPSTNAQEVVRTFTVVPPAVEKSFEPGQQTEGVMKVINDSNEVLSFTVEAQDFIVEDSKGTPVILPPNTLSKKFSASAWIGVYPNSFTIAPQEKQILNYYVQVPYDASPGGHYAAIVFSPTNASGVDGTGTAVETKIGSLFYVGVNGPINEYATVSEFFANPFQEYGPVTVETQIKNLGDLHIKPVGTVRVTDLLGRTVNVEDLDQFNIFPTATRDYENTFGQKFMVGRYKATLIGSYGKGSNLPLMATVYFWVFPWKITLLVILVIVATVLGVKYIKRKKHSTT